MKLNRSNYQNIWFTSDFHLGHDRSFIYQKRGFTNIIDHDEFIIETCNALADKNDFIFHLGDFTFKSRKTCREYREAITCRNIVCIEGNHDHDLIKYLASVNQKPMKPMLDLQVKTATNNQCITLCHYPMMGWNKSHHGSWNLCGHSHGSHPQSLPDYVDGKRLDVGVDVGIKFNNTFMFTFEDLVGIMDGKLITIHH